MSDTITRLAALPALFARLIDTVENGDANTPELIDEILDEAKAALASFYPSGDEGGAKSDSRGNEPLVDPTKRESAIAWLIWNDPNGCYTDADTALEFPGEAPLSLAAALAHIAGQTV